MSWRDGGRGRGGGGHHFDNVGFGHRGGGGRFRGGGDRGRGGGGGRFQGPRGGGGDRGGPGGFRGGPRFRMPNNDGPPPFWAQQQHPHQHPHQGGQNGYPGPGGFQGGPPGPGPIGPEPFMENGDDNVWAEAMAADGKTYFYHTKTRETTWERPEGPGVKIVKHEEWGGGHPNNKFNNNMDQGGGFHPGPGPGDMDQGMYDDEMHGQGMDHHHHHQPHPDFDPSLRHQQQQQQHHNELSPNQMQQSPSQLNPNLESPNQVSPDSTNPLIQQQMPPNQQQMMNVPPPGLNKLPNMAGPPMMQPFPPQNQQPFPPQNQQFRMPPPNQFDGKPPGLMSFPPFGGPGQGPPQFGGMPPGFPPQQNFPMVPPPWAMGPTPPSGVPPPVIQIDALISQHIDPKIQAKAYLWSEHVSPEGKTYFYNNKTQLSVWEKPSDLLEFEAAKIAAQQKMAGQQSSTKSEDKPETHSYEAPAKMNKDKKDFKKENTKGRPVSSTPVSGTPWCVVWTGDRKVFFYNPSTKQSVWERPKDLENRYDVSDLLSSCPSDSKDPKEEAPAVVIEKLKKDQIIIQETTIQNEDVTNSPSDDERPPGDDECVDKEPPSKKVKITEKDVIHLDDEDETQIITIEDESKISEDSKMSKIDALKGVNALEAEVKAAKERMAIPSEVRLKQFHEMLIEKQVSAFSTWEKELHKIVFDSRYLLLNSKERKVAFDNFVKDRAEEERKEKKSRIKQTREQFTKFLKELHLPIKMSYSEFSQKYGRDDRYKLVEKSRDREAYYTEFMQEEKRKDKELKEEKKEIARQDFLVMLKAKMSDYRLKWSEVRKKFEGEPKKNHNLLDDEERETLFIYFQRELKAEMKRKEKRNKKEKERAERKKKKKSKDKSKDRSKEKDKDKDKDKDEKEKSLSHSESTDIEEGLDANKKKKDVDEKNKSVELDNKSPKKDEDNGEQGELGELSDEEGAISSESEADEAVKKRERVEQSIREREKEVQRTLATHLRDRDKEREFFRHEEAIQEFQALLADLVRNSEANWKDTKKILKKDRRWSSVEILSRDEMEDLFTQHSDNIAKKKKQRFRELLTEAGITLTSRWKDIRKKIKSDPRYLKFSSSERRCEREFELFQKDLSAKMKGEFRELLKETKMLTYKTKSQIRETPHILKDIESLLSKDKRYLQLDSMPDERHRLLIDYLDDAEKRGPPPPPTANAENRRLK